jgi:hypothetical protein
MGWWCMVTRGCITWWRRMVTRGCKTWWRRVGMRGRWRVVSRGMAWRSFVMVMVVTAMVATMAMVLVVRRAVVGRWFRRRQLMAVTLAVLGATVPRQRRLGIGRLSRCFCRREGVVRR